MLNRVFLLCVMSGIMVSYNCKAEDLVKKANDVKAGLGAYIDSVKTAVEGFKTKLVDTEKIRKEHSELTTKVTSLTEENKTLKKDADKATALEAKVAALEKNETELVKVLDAMATQLKTAKEALPKTEEVKKS
jgi:uncharacterized protein (DUF3084 family)